MTPLLSLPNELSWNIVSALEIEDVINLSQTSRQLYQYVFSDPVSRAVVQVSEIILKSTEKTYAIFIAYPLKGQDSTKQGIHHGDENWLELGASLADMGEENGGACNGKPVFDRHRRLRANLSILQRCFVVHA